MSAIAWTGSSVVIAAVDGSGNLKYWWQKADTTPWNPETVASAGPGGIPVYFWPAIAWTGSSVVISAVDSSKNLDYWWQQADTTLWHKETVANLA
jgi:uncharacterized protein YccT (UPF0319 family)